MEKIILDKQQISDLVVANHYPVDPQRKFLSRCIDGRYDNNPNLPPLAIPGGDAGELAVVFATGNTYGFEVDGKKTFQTLVEVVGGVKNTQFHTDSHSEAGIPAGGCGHLKQMILDPKAYAMEAEQIDLIKTLLSQAKNKGACETILHGEHLEGAVLQVRGKESILPRFTVEAGRGEREVEVFVYQASLVDARHRLLAQKLIANKAVKLYNDLDADYLYQAISEVTEDHLMETAKRLAKGLPIYAVSFKDKDGFEIKEMGRV